MGRRILCVDDEPAILITLAAILRKHNFVVSTAASVPEALQKITSEEFDVLLSDLNIGNPGDGLTVVSAMRRTQPGAVTMIITGYPAFETALEAIRQQVDDYVVKPANIPALVRSIESKLATSPDQRRLPPTKRVAMLLQEHLETIGDLWMSSVESDTATSQVRSSREQRLGFVRGLLKTVIVTAQSYSGEEVAEHKASGLMHNEQRKWEGYTPGMMLTEFCILRRIVAQVVQENLLAVNLSYVVPDLARVNETLDEQARAALEKWF